ncbi:hypothetical protein [Sphingomonas endophytica]|uniref:Uncharacterized protein n=1 Tax=Sphingomonas endophytica TaxID=869719 RepID=A0A147I3E5_9SPHN|nr:hypothetical protein [Sphingomonas endophytica]KTT72615.1 hypothetical protein NS334_08450 [Sphingomonas endophytica]
MAIIQPPARLPLRGIKWRCAEPATVNRSGWTNTSKLVGLPGAGLWSATGTFVTIIGERAALRWRGFFTALRGQRHVFPLVAIERQRQTTIANPRVASGATGGDTLPLKGLPASTAVLLCGELMTVPLPSGHQRLVCLTRDLVSDGAGTAIAAFGPELGEAPAADALVEIGEPFALVRQTSEPPGWDVDVGQTYTFPLAIEEAR